MLKIWIYHPKLKRRVWLYAKDDVWRKKLRRFAEKILELDGPISIRRAARAADVHRETARKHLKILEENGLLMSATEGMPPRKVYLISEDQLLKEVYDELKIIRNSFFNRGPPTTDKVRGFNNWGPGSQKLIEDVEKALWT